MADDCRELIRGRRCGPIDELRDARAVYVDAVGAAVVRDVVGTLGPR